MDPLKQGAVRDFPPVLTEGSKRSHTDEAELPGSSEIDALTNKHAGGTKGQRLELKRLIATLIPQAQFDLKADPVLILSTIVGQPVLGLWKFDAGSFYHALSKIPDADLKASLEKNLTELDQTIPRKKGEDTAEVKIPGARFENSPLMNAVFNENTGAAKAMALHSKRLSVDINSGDKNGTTPLMAAAVMRKPDVFCCLVDCGADISKLDSQKNNVLHFIALSGNIEAFNNLKEHPGWNALLGQANTKGLTPLDLLSEDMTNHYFSSIAIGGGETTRFEERYGIWLGRGENDTSDFDRFSKSDMTLQEAIIGDRKVLLSMLQKEMQLTEGTLAHVQHAEAVTKQRIGL